MTTADELLRLIDTVDRHQIDKLDDLDVLVDWYLYPQAGYHLGQLPGGRYRIIKTGHYAMKPIHNVYTRSRDALKAIRPFPGWCFTVGLTHCEAIHFDRDVKLGKHGAKSEELAELHVIIQAIEYERTHK